ncbi:tannase/feruloyl esterase family alpha/beta hydrolase [Falsirhodobacter sp. 1013]|uniref:tannase/feruloyl esterase family alpha/beta hydrolase n=1 Tax=Falsirhodobacter sp. 1013 TaxID=3417566 RepID=UPI003EB80499
MTTSRWLAGCGVAGAALLAAGTAQARIDEGSCAALAGLVIPADRFGIPSGEAQVTDARFLAAQAEGVADGKRVPAQPDFCRLTGAIGPVSDAPPIRFQVNLPAEWIGKVVQYGGGGFNGSLVTGLDPLRDAPPTVPTPLMQGYVTAGTDSGHDAEELEEIQAFALNDEALENFAHAAYKKLHDLVVAVTAEAYGQALARYYYFGGSEGGREGLMMAQRYPHDFDGIVSAVPVINWVGLMHAGVRMGQLQRAEGGWLDEAAVKVLAQGAMAQCDALDGLEDGVIGNTPACRDVFDIGTLVCENGSEGCLKPAQAKVAETLRQPLDYGMALANGVKSYPGLPIGGEGQANGMQRWSTGSVPPSAKGAEEEARSWDYGNGMVRYFIAQDAEFDMDGYRMSDSEPRLREVSDLMDATDPDLSRFAEGGGKLILKENMADYAQSPETGIVYYDSVRETMGEEATETFLRFYTAAGADHSGRIFNAGGKALPSHVDLLAALDAWVEQGIEPGELELTAHDDAAPFRAVASRPLCVYPAYPYAVAGQFECRVP